MKKRENREQEVTRRSFLKIAGIAAVGAGTETFLPPIWLDDAVAVIPVSRGYLLVDAKKCQDCTTCMLACSLVHEGRENHSLARIQIVQNPFEKFLVDIAPALCRQCVDPPCVKICPTGALHADIEHGNVRRVDKEKCIGDMLCVEACPYEPSRAIWNFEDGYAQKCDLCATAPFWSQRGEPGGKQACVEACPLEAIKFTEEIPAQDGDAGYQANLRGESWKKMGYPVD